MKDKHKRIEQLIIKHIAYASSFERIDAAFMPMWKKGTQRYTCMGKDMAISLHMTKTVDIILKELL